MKLAVITQARMTSTRLPGKVLREAGGASMLEHHISRLAAAKLPVVVATTTNVDDDPVAVLADKLGAGVVRGSEHDVLSRYALAIREYQPEIVVRVTSDCPLIDGEVIRRGVEAWEAAGDPSLYASNALERTYPRGLDFEVFSAAALLEADQKATETPHREHVTPWLYTDESRPKLNLPWERDASAYRITLDTPEDFEVLRTLIEEHDGHHLDTAGLVAVLDAHPELVELNAQIEQKKLGQ
ncbi:MAG: glycosyltransferase family protein [Nocardioides sp.]|nr:glycosyltransferase family protein [Nocardioides sp.]